MAIEPLHELTLTQEKESTNEGYNILKSVHLDNSVFGGYREVARGALRGLGTRGCLMFGGLEEPWCWIGHFGRKARLYRHFWRQCSGRMHSC